jgi:hypothetical protein
MAIDEKKFKAILSDRFVGLMKSQKGLQAKLAKSIGKQSNFFSEITRGKPVNALHLKAIEIVFGYQKVIELLSMDDNGVKRLPHPLLVLRFLQEDLAYEINRSLIELEKIEPTALEEVLEYIKFKIFKQNEAIGKKEENSDHNGSVG